MRRRLQSAALELFDDHGYDATTAAEIAKKVGVTERTFFRHFPDKREVLFDSEMTMGAALSHAVTDAEPGLGPCETLRVAMLSVRHLIEANRSFVEPRLRVIARSAALQERELTKVKALADVLVAALVKRGVPANLADLSAQLAMAVLGQSVDAWLADGGELGDHIERTFDEVRKLAS